MGTTVSKSNYMGQLGAFVYQVILFANYLENKKYYYALFIA